MNPVRGCPPGSHEFEVVWPRRFALDAMRAMLGGNVDQILCDVLAGRVNAPIWSLVDRGGRRWRPTVTRLAYLASGGVPPAPAPIGEIVELLHTGSLVIDDIQDGATERRGGPAAHAVFGTATALNAANTAYFRALDALRDILPDGQRLRALDMLAEELFAAHLGQALDLAMGSQLVGSQLQHAAIRTVHYSVVARAKTGALVRMAARLGAIAADADEAAEGALGEWASELGLAYQISNDLEDLAGDMHDVITCRPTYPLLLVLDRDDAAASALRGYLGRAALTAADVAALRELFTQERVAERGRAAARLAAGRAIAALRSLREADARAALEQMALDLAGGAPLG